MPDEISFLGLTGTSDLTFEYFSFEPYFHVHTLTVLMCSNFYCFSLFHKDKGR